MQSPSEQLVSSLRASLEKSHEPADVPLIETHISWILLAGELAYKIKKPVDLGFVDFTTLEKRRHFCFEELRLNRRFAPELYLDVVPITGTLDSPQFEGSGPPLEYAVRMRRFPDDALLSRQLTAGRVMTAHVDGLASDVARFHQQTARAAPQSPFATPSGVLQPVRECLDQLCVSDDSTFRPQLDEIGAWVGEEAQRLQDRFLARKQSGFIRECHGDMHLANMVLLGDRVVLFDCIEFNDDFRWIDVQSEIAFCVMDFEDRGRPDFAHRFLNAYLAATGDYDGVAVLRFYLVYRALVRAKVSRLRQLQAANDGADTTKLECELQNYLRLAHEKTRPKFAAILLTHGFSGSGKSTGTQRLLDDIGAIRVRSDVERKRLFHLHSAPAAEDSTPAVDAAAAGALYSRKWTTRTYDALFEAARCIAGSGFPVILDATFLKRRRRQRFHQLADELGVPFVILDFQASHATLAARVSERKRVGADPSDAGVAVLQRQLQDAEPLNDQERRHTITIDTEQSNAWDVLCASTRQRLSDEASRD